MSSALHRTTKEYLESVNTPEYPTETWIINPDLSSVSGVDSKYWKITGDVVSEMNQTEKDAADTAEQEAEIIESVIVDSAAESILTITDIDNVDAQKLRASLQNVTADDYIVHWAYEFQIDNKGKSIQVRVQLDDTTDISNVTTKRAYDGFETNNGMKKVTLTSGDHYFDLDFASGDLGQAVRIKNAILRAWRK